MKTKVKNIYYCKECDQLYNSCYELYEILMCSRCFSENVRELEENEIQKFIRFKRLEHLKNIKD